MAETVMDFKHAYHMWLTRLDDVETATYKSAFDAGVDAANAALAQKDEEIDRLTKERDDAQSMTRLVSRANDSYAGIEDELNTLRSQFEHYKKDAERYRWLRGKIGVTDWGSVSLPCGSTKFSPELTDAEIDAARKQSEVMNG